MNMTQAVRREASPRPKDLPCPFCGADPPLAVKIAGRFIVGCDGEDCAAHPQVAADTLNEAWTRWNRRAP